MIISVVNRSKGKVTDRELGAVIRAVNKQIKRDFVPFWGMPCTLQKAAGTRLRRKGPSMQDACVVYLQKEIDVKDALGYHEANNAGIPFGVVCTDLSAELDEPWSVTFSHEVLELIADPQANLLVMGPHPGGVKRDVFHWFEMCDAVQASSYAIDGVSVSNFVLPFYFTPGAQTGQNDFLRTGIKSFKVNKGGYVGFFDPEKKDDDTFELKGDKLAKRRFAIKQQLGRARRAARYRMSDRERGRLLGRLKSR